MLPSTRRPDRRHERSLLRSMAGPNSCQHSPRLLATRSCDPRHHASPSAPRAPPHPRRTRRAVERGLRPRTWNPKAKQIGVSVRPKGKINHAKDRAAKVIDKTRIRSTMRSTRPRTRCIRSRPVTWRRQGRLKTRRRSLSGHEPPTPGPRQVFSGSLQTVGSS